MMWLAVIFVIVSAATWLPGDTVVGSSITPTLSMLMKLVPEASNLTLHSFLKFSEDYSRMYPSEEELIYRFSVFLDGCKNAAIMNEKSKKIGGATFGINSLIDITPQEFQDKYLMKNMPKNSTRKIRTKIPTFYRRNKET